MRASTHHLLFLLPLTYALSAPAPTSSTCQFIAPLVQQTPKDSLLELFRRQSSCQAGYNGCTNLGQPSACCTTTATCTTDANNNVACCPTGATCTGVLGSAATTTGSLLAGATTTANSLSPVTTAAGAGFVESTVPNQYFPFLYIPTTFANAEVCSSYYTSCQTEYSSCLTSLGGGGGVVASITSAATLIQLTGRQVATATGSAASVCSSLYSQGCYNLQEGYCASLSQSGAATGSGIIVTASGADGLLVPGKLSWLGIGLVMAGTVGWQFMSC